MLSWKLSMFLIGVLLDDTSWDFNAILAGNLWLGLLIEYKPGLKEFVLYDTLFCILIGLWLDGDLSIIGNYFINYSYSLFILFVKSELGLE